MTMKLFVAGLPFTMSDDDLRDLFAEYGNVQSAQIITDRDTRKSKGFGFVEFSTEAEGKAAITALNGKEMNGRPLTVNAARAREERPTRSFQNDRSTISNNYRRSNR